MATATKPPLQPAAASGTAAAASAFTSAAVAASASSSPKFVRKTLTTVFIALLIDILAFTIILPLYPRILEHYEAVDGQDEFISSPIIGSLSDAYGRRQILLLSMIGNAVSMLLWIFSRSFGVFVCSRIVGGLTEGNVQMSIAVISDVTTKENRSKGLALVGIAFSLGFTVGPPLGAYFTSVDLLQVFPFLRGLPVNQYSSPALFAFVLIMIETVYLYIALPETRDHHRLKLASTTTTLTKTASSSSSATTTTTKTTTRDASTGPSPPPPRRPPPPPRPRSQITTLATLHFLFLFFFSGMEFTLTFLTHDRFQFTHARQGRLLAFIGVSSALVQGLYTRRVTTHTRFSERAVVAQGVAAASCGLGVLGYMANNTTDDGGGGGGEDGVWWLYVGAAFLAFTSGTVVTGLTALASYETGLRQRQQKQQGQHQHHQQQQHQDDVVVVGEYDEVPGAGTGGGAGGGGGGDRGKVLGRFRSVGQLGRALGPLFACTMYWVFGSRAAYGVGAAAMAVVACATWSFAPAGAVNNNKRHAVAASTTTTTRDKKEL
ncbi:hypothetical protein HDU87_007091 [Geranomyces variabilis]|uniref:Major facilitator superfamily (MFS) profile domain-containing protein n=1 Tax=Geranomyces variabilis TaxID=109894 RepID=A0AAD5XNK2_9FUNG|nr:hypothetical protein HDU87_007091 [Geranomyces variabilis]